MELRRAAGGHNAMGIMCLPETSIPSSHDRSDKDEELSDDNSGRRGLWIDPPIEFRDSPPRAAFRADAGRRAVTPPPNHLQGYKISPLSSSRLSISHNSLPSSNLDDSNFITSAMSHNILSDLYNVPMDSDIYTLPIDTIQPPPRHRKHRHKRRRRHTTADTERDQQKFSSNQSGIRKSVPPHPEPVHMTLHEVRQFLHTLYSGDKRDSVGKSGVSSVVPPSEKKRQRKQKQSPILEEPGKNGGTASSVKTSFSHLLKRTLCNMFRLKRSQHSTIKPGGDSPQGGVLVVGVSKGAPTLAERALPPLPESSVPTLITYSPNDSKQSAIDFASSIEKVKDYGWYWGPISGESAEKILSNEPDGSFIVRDSSDQNYIFSLTFRLNGCVRHVRIEHDQGNFSFGSCTKFKSQTIMEFIETAVEHSRSGRYLFFLHRRPVLGPMRVQLLHPVSRFKHVQSLQHLCRFVIVKSVRRDLIESLPLPRRLIDYLNSPHYYSEQLAETVGDGSSSPSPPPPSLHLFSFLPPN